MIMFFIKKKFYLVVLFMIIFVTSAESSTSKAKYSNGAEVEVGVSGETSTSAMSKSKRERSKRIKFKTYPGEEVLWLAGRDDEKDMPNIDAIRIFMPEEISKISTFTISHGGGSRTSRRRKTHKCGFESATVVFDHNGDMLLASIDNFFDQRTITNLRSFAINKANWKRSPVHPSSMNPQDPTKSNGFPGFRADTPAGTNRKVMKCLEPVLPIFDKMTKFNSLKADETIFGLVAPLNDTEKYAGIKWLDSQRIPHTDIRWDMGVSQTGVVAQCYASVLSLTQDWNESGTGLWVEHETGFSLLKTSAMNSEVFSRINPEVKNHLHPEIDLYKEIPDPAPQHKTKHAWAQVSVLAELRYNRFVLYDGRRLHQQYFHVDDSRRLTNDPTVGRLTMNSFFWTSIN